MNPFLEGQFWRSFHGQFCAELARQLTPVIGPRYIALLEERLVLDSLDDITISTRNIQPDVSVVGTNGESSAKSAVMEPPLRMEAPVESEQPIHFVEIREANTMVVVTVIELLSPANKNGHGRTEYLSKRRSVLNSDANLVEIDLLRDGERLPMREQLPDAAYFVFIHRAAMRPLADVWPIALPDPLPTIGVPLLPPDSDAVLDLQSTLRGAIDSAGYERFIDYDRDLTPPLSSSEQDWVKSILSGTAG
jgi:hypothetical protein